MAEQACNWCGAAVAQGICTRCGLSADEASQTTSFSPAAFASFDPALADTDPDLPIIPGMIAEVEIITGEKSVLTYLLKPVLRAKARAFSER